MFDITIYDKLNFYLNHLDKFSSLIEKYKNENCIRGLLDIYDLKKIKHLEKFNKEYQTSVILVFIVFFIDNGIKI